ncbi:hypothetical protein HJ032_22180 [Vibrio parahaemolyticus]|nr:hypothetical protein [Vibrio parahaemolyticus]MBE4367910.1 hypothetical protein [Vibrio parahaemolyticus]
MDADKKLLSKYQYEIEKFIEDWLEETLESIDSHLEQSIEEAIDHTGIQWAYELEDIDNRCKFVQELCEIISVKVFNDIQPLVKNSIRNQIACDLVGTISLEVIEENNAELVVEHLGKKESARLFCAGIFCSTDIED